MGSSDTREPLLQRMVTSYYIPVMDIESIQAVTGLLNRGIYVYQKNGSKTKLPLAVEHEEMEKFAKVLEDFVRYLQEKPFSRKESYICKGKTRYDLLLPLRLHL